jgi:peptidoglycan/LPS O-acetylase OafA/YrhL
MKSLNIAYNPRIDQLRWLAAMLVFLFHFHLEYRGIGGPGLSSPWFALVTEGHTGVGLFFTLSGFLFMQIALHQGALAYGPFVRNRLLRIFPLFLTIFLVATSIGRDKFQPQDILYLLSSNLGFAPTSISVVTGAAWCISLEFMFYMIFPFLSRFAMARGVRYLLGLLALMMFFKVAAYSVNEKSTLMYFSTFVGRFDQFLIGMLAAMLFARHGAWLRRYAAWLLLPAAALAVADSALLATVAPFATTTKSLFWIIWSTIESAGWACVIVAWVACEKVLPAAVERFLNHGGKISFSFYLLHMGVLHALAQAIGMTSPTGEVLPDALIMFAVCYAATWALATLSYHVIEEPFLQMRRSYGSGAGKSKTLAAVADTAARG